MEMKDLIKFVQRSLKPEWKNAIVTIHCGNLKNLKTGSYSKLYTNINFNSLPIEGWNPENPFL